MTGRSLAATLGVLASIATILTFLITAGNSTSTTLPPQPGQITPTGPSNPVGPSNLVGPSNPTASAYPASGENTFLTICEQQIPASPSHCQCDLTYAENNIPYSDFVMDETYMVSLADNYSGCS